jgi:hypothetical protein
VCSGCRRVIPDYKRCGRVLPAQAVAEKGSSRPSERRQNGGNPSSAGAQGAAAQRQQRGGYQPAKWRGAGVRPERYLAAAAGTADGQSVARLLDQDPEVAVLRTIGSARPASGYPPITVIETTAERGVMLASDPIYMWKAISRWAGGTRPSRGTSMITASAVGPAGEMLHLRTTRCSEPRSRGVIGRSGTGTT